MKHLEVQGGQLVWPKKIHWVTLDGLLSMGYTLRVVASKDGRFSEPLVLGNDAVSGLISFEHSLTIARRVLTRAGLFPPSPEVLSLIGDKELGQLIAKMPADVRIELKTDLDNFAPGIFEELLLKAA